MPDPRYKLHCVDEHGHLRGDWFDADNDEAAERLARARCPSGRFELLREGAIIAASGAMPAPNEKVQKPSRTRAA